MDGPQAGYRVLSLPGEVVPRRGHPPGRPLVNDAPTGERTSGTGEPPAPRSRCIPGPSTTRTTARLLEACPRFFPARCDCRRPNSRSYRGVARLRWVPVAPRSFSIRIPTIPAPSGCASFSRNEQHGSTHSLSIESVAQLLLGAPAAHLPAHALDLSLLGRSVSSVSEEHPPVGGSPPVRCAVDSPKRTDFIAATNFERMSYRDYPKRTVSPRAAHRSTHLRRQTARPSSARPSCRNE